LIAPADSLGSGSPLSCYRTLIPAGCAKFEAPIMTVVPALPEQVDHSLRPVENSKVCDLAQSFRPALAIAAGAFGPRAPDKSAVR
jgi:hypothetical protein